MKSKTAVLLINLGTPSDTSNKAIRSYLREFLLDHRVIDLPWPLRYILVNCLIIPFRYKSSQHAYKSIWTEDGSPLLVNSLKLQQKLLQLLNPSTPKSKQEQPDYDVWLAMRYGEPRLSDILTKLQQNNYTRIIIVPLYPQYASASTGSVLEKSLKHLSDFRYFPKIICINEFYNHPGYINSLTDSIKNHLPADFTSNIPQGNTSDTHLLFSYHGVPKRQLELTNNIKATEPDNNTLNNTYSCDFTSKPTCSSSCTDSTPCPALNKPETSPYKCYRAQCYETTRAIANKLNLQPEQYSTSFQSRLGKLPWIKPYTDEMLSVLRNKGISKLYVACPSFVSDCLETLEEIGMQLKKCWLEQGGSEFHLIPCLNDDELWVQELTTIIKEA